MAKVSVIIPCYNHGVYLDQAVDSVLAQTYDDLEIIVVNDGSTDPKTREILSDYNRDKTSIITTENQGLASARNNGIKQAQGEYILPLDADDRIAPEYIEKCVAVLEDNADVGIVYSKAKLFGEVNTEWLLPEYSLEEMLKENVIFCTALFRRSDWEEVGGYDPGMIYGWEDYDLWLSFIERGREVRQLNDYYFYYRVASDSMVRSKEKWQKVEMFKRIFQRHSSLIGENIEIWLNELLDIREKYYMSRLYIDCGKGFREKESVSLKTYKSTKKLVFEIDTFIDRKTLRFDPVDAPACVRIISVMLIGKEFKVECGKKEIDSNALCWHDDILMFDTDDPQVFLKMGEEKISQVSKVIIELDFVSIGENALRDIINFQKNVEPAHILTKILPSWLAIRNNN